VSEDLEDRVERLEESVTRLSRQLENLVDVVDDVNKNQMSNLYRRLVEEGRLEEMRDKYPDMVNDLEQTAEDHIAPKIEQELRDNSKKNGEGDTE